MKCKHKLHQALFACLVVSSLLNMKEKSRNANVENQTEDNMDNREFNKVNQTLDHELYQSIYHAYHRGVGLRGSMNQNKLSQSARNETAVRLDLASYGEDVMHKGCELTVLIMDPRISSSRSGAPVYFALESVAAYLPNACVVIQTSNCRLHKTSTNTNNKDGSDETIYKSLYESSLPLFRGMIEVSSVN